jgi:transposase
LDERVAVLDSEIARHARENAAARRLMTIPGIGTVTAAALTALAPPAPMFRRGSFRCLARADPGSALQRGQGAARQDI